MVLLLRHSTQWSPLNEVYLLSKFHISSFYTTGDIDFQTARSAADLEQLKNDTTLQTLGKPELILLAYFLQTLGSSVILLSLGKTLVC